MEDLFPSNLYLEIYIADLVVSKANIVAFLTLLSEDVLNKLIDEGMIATDSFGYVVCTHYKEQLRMRIASEVAGEEQVQTVAQIVVAAISKLEALLSLALFFTPAGKAIKLFSAALGLGVLAYQSYSIIHHLAKINAEISANALALDLEGAETIARVSELATMRGEYLNEINEEVSNELFFIAAGSAWFPFKSMLEVRTFYSDLNTLVGE